MNIDNIDITKDETDIANKEALYIFGYLRKKYCNENVSDLDKVLNSLCFSLLRLIHLYVPKKDAMDMVDIIHAILKKGIEQIQSEKD